MRKPSAKDLQILGTVVPYAKQRLVSFDEPSVEPCKPLDKWEKGWLAAPSLVQELRSALHGEVVVHRLARKLECVENSFPNPSARFVSETSERELVYRRCRRGAASRGPHKREAPPSVKVVLVHFGNEVTLGKSAPTLDITVVTDTRDIGKATEPDRSPTAHAKKIS